MVRLMNDLTVQNESMDEKHVRGTFSIVVWHAYLLDCAQVKDKK